MIRALWNRMDDVFLAWLKGDIIKTVNKPCKKAKKFKPEGLKHVPDKNDNVGVQTRSQSKKRKAKEQKEGEESSSNLSLATKKFKTKKEQTIRQPKHFDEKRNRRSAVTRPKQTEITQNVERDSEPIERNNTFNQTQTHDTKTNVQKDHNPGMKKLYVLLCENNKR